jgi:hypothetical protein
VVRIGNAAMTLKLSNPSVVFRVSSSARRFVPGSRRNTRPPSVAKVLAPRMAILQAWETMAEPKERVRLA